MRCGAKQEIVRAGSVSKVARSRVHWLELGTHVAKHVGTHYLPDLARPDNLLRFEDSGILTSLQPGGGLDSPRSG